MWTKTFGGSEGDKGWSVQQTSDGGYIIAGYTDPCVTCTYDVWLIKTNANGDTVWTNTFGGNDNDQGISVDTTNDGGYIITGFTNSFGAGNSDVLLIKTNENGEIIRISTFGGSGDDWGASVNQTNDGGYILTGKTTSFGAGNQDAWLIKTNANGDTLWTKTFGDSLHDFGNSVQQTSDGGYIIVGSTESFGAGKSDVWLIRTDVNGDTLWTKTFGDSLIDAGASVQQTTDGGYIITGMIGMDFDPPVGFFGGDVWMIKTDSNGDTLWTKTFGGSHTDGGSSIQQTIDGGYIIAGTSASDVLLIKTDGNGDALWTKTFWGSHIDQGNSVQQTIDGGYIIAGATRSFGAGNYDVWLIKVAPDVTTIGENPHTSINSYQLKQNFPNPFNLSTTIEFTLPEASEVKLTVYDALGKEVETLINGLLSAGQHRTVWQANNLPSGVYFYRLSSSPLRKGARGDVITRKMLLMK